jgi:hypothetical protein
MHSTSLLRRLALLLVFVLFATPWAWAVKPAARAAGSSRVADVSPADLFGRAWSFLAAFWANEGGHIDPDGRFASGLPSKDTGGHLDPDGSFGHSSTSGPAGTPSTDTGGHLDPNG